MPHDAMRRGNGSGAARESLQRMLTARRVALVGASRDPGKLGHQTLETMLRCGFEGEVLPVNSRAESVLGLRAYPSVVDIPGDIDSVIVVTPALTVAGILRQAAAKGAAGAIVLSAGFREAGRADLEDELLRVCKSTGLRLLGPNIQGVAYLPNRLCAAFWPALRVPGAIGVVGQSGSVTAALAEWAEEDGLGVSAMINLGNQADLRETDAVDFLVADERTRAVALYIEGVKDGRAFMEVMQRAAAVKPIAILKSGRTEAGRVAAVSHTASLGGSDKVFAAACRQCGVVRAADMESLYDCAKSMAMLSPPGNRVMVVSSSGGGGGLAVDEMQACGLSVADLSPEYLRELTEIGVGERSSRTNPLDLGGVEASWFEEATAAAMRHDIADVYLLVFGDPICGGADAVARLSALLPRRLAVCYFGGGSTQKKDVPEIQRSGVPVFPTPERAVRALGAALLSHAEV